MDIHDFDIVALMSMAEMCAAIRAKKRDQEFKRLFLYRNTKPNNWLKRHGYPMRRRKRI